MRSVFPFTEMPSGQWSHCGRPVKDPACSSHRPRRSVRLASRLGLVPLLFCCLVLGACLESRLPEGVVATVNGEPIHLRAVQALLDSRSAALGTLQRPTLENLKRQYGEALGTLIIHALVRQELQRLQISVPDTALEQAVAVVEGDYGPDGLSRFLADESLDQEEWRALMRDHLALLTFEKRVLLPGFHVKLPEVRAYYQAHQKEFQLPETLEVCFVSAERREALDAFCKAFPAGRTTSRGDLLAQCLDVKADELPPPWRKEIAALKPGTCGSGRLENGSWQAVALVQRQQPRTLEIADAYPLIENILLEEKKNKAFEQWLEGSLARAVIKVSPFLKEDLLTPRSARPRENEPADSRDGSRPGDGDVPEFDAGADVESDSDRNAGTEQDATQDQKRERPRAPNGNAGR